MAIVWNATTNQFEVQGRIGFDQSTRKLVNKYTGQMQKLIPYWLSPVERSYDPLQPHNAQNTMRAHHIADSVIQQMVCDYMNGRISYPVLLDRLGTLYQTSWIDIIVTPRLMIIWRQWIRALTFASDITRSSLGTLTKDEQAALATRLARELSSSVANLRIGHGPTDQRLGQAIAPRLQRGVIISPVARFIAYLNRQSLHAPTFSFETSVAHKVWRPHFARYPLNVGGGFVQVGDVFVGPAAGGILISEEFPVGGAKLAIRPLPLQYPGTQGKLMYFKRITRSSCHIFPLLTIVTFSGYGLYKFSKSRLQITRPE